MGDEHETTPPGGADGVHGGRSATVQLTAEERTNGNGADRDRHAGAGDPSAPSEELVRAKVHLERAGIVCRWSERDPSRLQFELPASDSHRLVELADEDAWTVLSSELTGWLALGGMLGVVNRSTGVAEVVVRDKSGLTSRQLMTWLNGDWFAERRVALNLAAPDLSATIGVADRLSAILLQPIRGRWGRAPVTLRIEGLAEPALARAEQVAEQVVDAILFDLELATGIGISPVRVDRFDPGDRREPRQVDVGSLRLGANRYDHEAVVLYSLGRDRSLPPSIRFWAYCQVLEFYLPHFELDQAVERTTAILKHPRFSAHDSRQVAEVIAVARGTTPPTGSTDTRMAALISRVVDEAEVEELVGYLGLAEHLATPRPDLTDHTIDLARPGTNLTTSLARRIHDVRGRIVGSDDGRFDGLVDGYGGGHQLGTVRDDLVAMELPIVEFLAERAIVICARPLT